MLVCTGLGFCFAEQLTNDKDCLGSHAPHYKGFALAPNFLAQI